MKFKELHKNIYKFASHSLPQEKLEIHQRKYEKQLKRWQKLKSKNVSDSTCQGVLASAEPLIIAIAYVFASLRKEFFHLQKDPSRFESLCVEVENAGRS